MRTNIDNNTQNICNIIMAHSFAHVLVHIIFSTKNRIAFLQSQNLRSEVHAYLVGTLRALESESLRVGGIADHVHILAALSRKTSLADLVQKLKTSSAKIVREKGHRDFSWQSGYGVFSVSESAKEQVISYITNQEIHHRTMTFQEEYRMFLANHRVRFDERYVWE
jgi:putative transposase